MSRKSTTKSLPKPLASSPSLFPASSRDAFIAELQEQFRRQLEEQLPDDEATLDQIEEAAGKIGRQISQDVQRRLIEQRSKQERTSKALSHVFCACGGLARYKGQQDRTLVTAHGTLTYSRPYYHCAICQHSFAPLDKALGIDSGVTTTQVRLWVALLAGQLPFAQAATTLQMLTRVSLSAASLERVSVRIGTALREHQHQQAQKHQVGALPEPTMKREAKPARLYIGLDGVFVPLRDAWKKDKSTGELSCRYGECICHVCVTQSGVVYEAFQDKGGKDSHVRTRAYVATLGKVEQFAPLLGTLAHQNGHHQAKEVIVIGDGAPWIWQLAAKQFAGAIQIVDFFHAAEHLGKVAEVRFGNQPDKDDSKAWLAARLAELKADQLDKVLDDLRAWRPTSESKKQLRQSTYAYFASNAERMRYKTFLDRGYHIGSGVVEATCKHVVAQRLDQAGMHWRQESAEAIVALRAAQLSTIPTDLTPYCTMPYS
jgi:hypothetical protein